MLSIITGTTVTNLNDNKSDRFINVKLHNINQTVKAVIGLPTNLDSREQLANIKVGTEVLMLVDELNSFFIINSLNQGIELVNKQIYIVENKEEVKLSTDNLLNIKGVTKQHIDKTEHFTEKLKIENSAGNEIVSLMSELIQIIHDLVAIGNGGQESYLDPATQALLQDLKNRHDTFKI